jgi:CheY-like chemotaxis protein
MGELLKGSLGPTFSIVQHLPKDLGPVLVDVNQFELAVLNLALNARDAMPGGGAITISASEEEMYPGASDSLQPGLYVSLSVTDTGSGMDAATLARATEPFFTTKGTGKGTGLGLSMVQGLAAQSGGGLRIQSRLGRGTRVDLLLPRSEEVAGSMSPTHAAAPPMTAGRATILLVDDDALVSTGTAAMLEDLGHDVIEASTGDQALELLEASSGVDLVITDHAMPGMTGAELAKVIQVRFPELPVILATGYAELPAAAGATNLPRLTKPYLQHDLEVILAQHLRPRPEADGPTAAARGG